MNSRGFTLIELLVVIAIIGVLSSVVLASLSTARTKANDARRISDARQLVTALALAADANNGTFPSAPAAKCLGTTGSCWGGAATGDATLNALVQPFMARIPTDPTRSSGKGDRYLYVGPDGLAAQFCNGVNNPSGPYIIWVPDDTEPTSQAECKSVGFYACCGSITCPTGYYCALPI
jgi:prepilin-type N-terminal cleavage/methylation domain-containing protein